MNKKTHSPRARAVSASVLRVLACLFPLFGPAALEAADNGDAEKPAATSRFFDAGDGWLDISGFLDTAYGFVPVLASITEPAVGCGAADTRGGRAG